MTIYHSAYDTTVGMGFNLNKTVLALKKKIIEESWDTEYPYGNPLSLDMSSEVLPAVLLGASDSRQVIDVPVFAHPLMMQSAKGTKFLFSDLRACAKSGTDMTNIVINNQTEFDFNKHRLIADLIWITEGVAPFSALSNFACAVYSSWISESVARRFALDPKDQLSLAVISAMFYQMLFIEGSEQYLDYAKEKMASIAIKATNAPANFVFQTIDKIDYMQNLESFCSNIVSALDNPRMQNFNAGILIAILGNSWFGANAKEIVAVSLEHPPTWLSLIDASFRSRAYKNSAIAKLTERLSSKKNGADFIKQFNFLLLSKTREQT